MPLHESKRPIIHHVIENISLSDYPLTCLVLVNNSSYDFYEYILEMCADFETSNVDFQIIDLGKIEYDRLGQIYSHVVNMGYEIAYRFGFDYAVVIGADILIPDSAISEMLACFKKLKKTGVVCLTCYYRAPGIAPMPMVLPKSKMINKITGQPTYLSMNQYYAKKYLLVAAGNGAMMAPREVIHKVKWRVDDLGETGADIQFCLDVKAKTGRSCRIVTDLETPHIDNDGKLFWSKTPNELEPVLKAIEAKNVEAKRE